MYGRSEIVHAGLKRKLKDKQSNQITWSPLYDQLPMWRIIVSCVEENIKNSTLLSELLAKMSSDLKMDERHRIGGGGANAATFDNWLFGEALCAKKITPYDYQTTKGRQTYKGALAGH